MPLSIDWTGRTGPRRSLRLILLQVSTHCHFCIRHKRSVSVVAGTQDKPKPVLPLGVATVAQEHSSVTRTCKNISSKIQLKQIHKKQTCIAFRT